MVKGRRAGRFHGYRKNCEFVPCLPARVVAAYLADPRRIPYLLVWVRRPLPIEKALKLAHPLEIRDCVRLASHSFRQGEAPEPGWVEAKRGDGRRIGIQVLERSLPRNGGKDLLLVCNHCHKPRRALYGWEALKHVRQIKTSDWVCRSCADLSYASEGGAGIFRTRWSVARPLSGLRLWPRPELWQPLVLTSPLQMLELGLVDNVYLNGARL
jgi:hypothetical protein